MVINVYSPVSLITKQIKPVHLIKMTSIKKFIKNSINRVLTRRVVSQSVPSTDQRVELYQLHEWIDETDETKLDWEYLSMNPNAIDLLEKNIDKIDWRFLSRNRNAVHLLEKNIDKIDWSWLSTNTNPKALQLLEKNFDKIHWGILSENPNAIRILEKNQDKIKWIALSLNPNAIHLLEQNMDKLCWYRLSYYNRKAAITSQILGPHLRNLSRHLSPHNIDPDEINWNSLRNTSSVLNLSLNESPEAITFLEKNQDKIDWENLSCNPKAIHLLEKNQDKIDWKEISMNPAIFKKTINYKYLKERMDIIREELMMKSMHPSRLEKWIEMGGDYEDF